MSLRNTNICSARQYLINAQGTQQPRALRGAEVNGGKILLRVPQVEMMGKGIPCPGRQYGPLSPDLQGRGEGAGERLCPLPCSS